MKDCLWPLPKRFALIGTNNRMNQPFVQSPGGVTLVGGGPVPARDLSLCLRRAPRIVAADSGADRVLAAGLMPEAVIGDFDSVSPSALSRIPQDRQHPIAEQETTDFDKALRSITAPFVLGIGFVGARLDHGLAVFNTLARHADTRCLVIGPKDVVFAAPPALRLSMTIGDRFSLFPMAEVTGESTGLEWPLQGLRFAPNGMIGTSNRVVAPTVTLQFSNPGMLVILPRTRLDAAIAALTAG